MEGISDATRHSNRHEMSGSYGVEGVPDSDQNLVQVSLAPSVAGVTRNIANYQSHVFGMSI